MAYDRARVDSVEDSILGIEIESEEYGTINENIFEHLIKSDDNAYENNIRPVGKLAIEIPLYRTAKCAPTTKIDTHKWIEVLKRLIDLD